MAQITLNSTGVASNGSLVLQSNGTTAAVTINTSQIIGVGITPSAWGTGFQSVIETKNVGALSAAGPYMSILANAYYNSSNQYIYTTSNPATHYAQVVGQHQWFNAASGTAGNAITFTQAMTLDASGNLGIGTTSPSARLSVIAASANSTAATIGGIEYGGSKRGLTIKTFNSAGGDDCGVEFNAANGLGGYGAFKFAANTTTLATIDSSGNLLVGKTSSSATTGDGFGFSNDGQGHAVSAYTTNAAYTWRVYSTGAAAYRFYVGYGGTVYATSTTITAISDQRLKENIRDLDDGLDVVMALKPRKFDWKEGKGADIKNARGFIAQEFEAVLPDMIEEWADPAPEGEEPYKAINANLIPTLVKAIQELKAEFDAYKASHP